MSSNEILSIMRNISDFIKFNKCKNFCLYHSHVKYAKTRVDSWVKY